MLGELERLASRARHVGGMAPAALPHAVLKDLEETKLGCQGIRDAFQIIELKDPFGIPKQQWRNKKI